MTKYKVYYRKNPSFWEDDIQSHKNLKDFYFITEIEGKSPEDVWCAMQGEGRFWKERDKNIYYKMVEVSDESTGSYAVSKYGHLGIHELPNGGWGWSVKELFDMLESNIANKEILDIIQRKSVDPFNKADYNLPIERKHSSMSVGDILFDESSNKWYVTMNCGFEEIDIKDGKTVKKCPTCGQSIKEHKKSK